MGAVVAHQDSLAASDDALFISRAVRIAVAGI